MHGPASDKPASPVNSHTEWDPLEEVIVGHVDGATVPPAHITVLADIPRRLVPMYRAIAGMRHPRVLTSVARREVEEFVRLLIGEGVTVARPDRLNFKQRYRTPHWASSGFCAACPRDAFLVIGDEIIEAPMSWPSRFYEGLPYRALFKDYFARGARWTAAPRPELVDALYDQAYAPPAPGAPIHYVVTEHEPVFDAADFVRCGRDLFVTRSNVTNEFGIEWLRRHLGDGYRIHRIETRCPTPMHIDTTIMPLAPGKLLINPDWIDPARLPPVFRTWDILVAPPPDPLPVLAWRARFSMCSPWLSMNMLSLDAHRVVVEKSQTTMIRRLRDWGFKPIPCAFLNYAPFGGSFHCATLDIRRRGRLESYF